MWIRLPTKSSNSLQRDSRKKSQKAQNKPAIAFENFVILRLSFWPQKVTKSTRQCGAIACENLVFFVGLLRRPRLPSPSVGAPLPVRAVGQLVSFSFAEVWSPGFSLR